MTMRYHWSRAPGARTPKSARAVTRSTPYGNPFPIVHQRCLLPKNYRQKTRIPSFTKWPCCSLKPTSMTPPTAP